MITLSLDNVKSEGDRILYNLMKDKNGKDIAYDIKQVTQGVKRTVGFTNENVIATVGYVSAIAIKFMEDNNLEAFYHIKNNLQKFVVGIMNWQNFVRFVWELQKILDITNQFHDDVLTFIEYRSITILNNIDSAAMDANKIILAAKGYI